jgi:membrane protease YdiL (CAAX protease family)
MEPITNDFPESHDEPEFPHARFAYFSVILIFLGYQFAGAALHSLLARGAGAGMGAIVQGLGQALFMLVPAVVIMQYSPLRTHGLMRFGGAVTLTQWCIGLAGVLAVQMFAAGFAGVQERLIPDQVMPYYRRAEEAIEGIYRNLLGGSSPLDAARALLVGAVIPAFSEEILFRGVLQRSLEQVRTPRRAIVITACIFGILHLNPILVVPLIVIGVYLGFLAWYTQSLALPIVAHFLNNAFAIVALYAPEASQEAAAETGLSEVALLLFGLAGIGITVSLLLRTPKVASEQLWGDDEHS